MKNDVAIEVGANNGNDTANLIQSYEFVYAFEPNPDLYYAIVNRFAGAKNFLALPMAVDLENTIKTFHIADVGDRGYSSLYPYHPNLLNTALGKHEVYRQGFQRDINVATIRLDTFMCMYGIGTVKYLWVDAQGNDLNVLNSLGNHTSRVAAGRAEFTYKVPIYDNDFGNTFDDAKTFFDERGFSYNVAMVHADDSEVDVTFERK
tara:strand:- start:28898 stop:29512 length:615 start_codon:yes stop_codon:yes gene_type:complete